jgi:hypothetical protein
VAVLADADRAAVRDAWMHENNLPLGALSKADLRAAVDAIDDWADANAAAFNAAIPPPARTSLNARQKAWLFYHVVRRRFEVS